MKLFLIVILGLILAAKSETFEWDDPRVNALGMGFDILENEYRQSFFVLESNTRSDPSLPILTRTLPKGVVMLNTPTDYFHMYAEVIDKNVNTKDSRDIKASVGGGYGLISGSFSVESKTVKEFVSKMNHKVTRINSYATLAEFQLQTTKLPLSPELQKKIELIGHLLRKNTVVARGYATYITDEVINLFGTHFIIRQKIGGILSKIDSVDISGYQNNVAQTLSASAQASYASFFKIKGSYQTEHSEVDKYQKSVTDTLVITQGGETWKTADTFTYDTWTDSLKITPAIIGLHAVCIRDIIDEEYFGNFTFNELIQIRNLFENRNEVYYKNNFYMGCDDPTASNYVSYANVFDDKLCNYQETFHFGGMYTISNNGAFQTANILTQALSCPAGFDTKPILHLEFQGSTHSTKHCDERCHHSWFKKKCNTYCWTESWVDTVVTDTYICISQKNQTAGVYFGGMFTNNLGNDITQEKSCPSKYVQFPIYHDYGKTMTTFICMAQYDVGPVVAVPFGGIFSSQDPNYLVGNKPICGGGFERHSLGSNPTAELTYCIGIGSLSHNSKNLIPPGYGTNLNELMDFYPLYEFDNGTMVAIKVDPLVKSSYYDQMVSLSLNVLDNSAKSNDTHSVLHKINGIKTDRDNHESYLLKWIEENDIAGKYHINPTPLEQPTTQPITKVQTVADQSTSTVEKPIVFTVETPIMANENDSDISSTVYTIVAISIIATVMTLLVVVLAIRLYLITRRKSGYSSIE